MNGNIRRLLAKTVSAEAGFVLLLNYTSVMPFARLSISSLGTRTFSGIIVHGCDFQSKNVGNCI